MENPEESNIELLNIDDFENVIQILEKSACLGDLLAAEQLRFHVGVFRDIQIRVKGLSNEDKFKIDPRTGGLELNPIIKQALTLSSEIVKMVADLGLTSMAQAKLIKQGKDAKRAKSIEALKGGTSALPLGQFTGKPLIHTLKKAV